MQDAFHIAQFFKKFVCNIFVLNFTVYLFIETCLCVKDTLSARNNHVTNGMIDSLLMLRNLVGCNSDPIFSVI